MPSFGLRTPIMRILVKLGSKLIQCDVAWTQAEQVTGLSKRSSLREGEGMLFQFPSARTVTMTMSSVPFAIDIVFVESDKRIGRVVHNVLPGSRQTWTHSPTAAVVEVPGGFCWRHDIKAGDGVDTSRHGRAGALEGYSVDPERVFPGDHGEMSEDRFKDRDTPDVSDPDANDGPMPNWEQQIGYDQTVPAFDQQDAPSLFRMSNRMAQNVAKMPDGSIQDPVAFALGAIKALAAAAQHGDGLQWKPEPLSGGKEQFAVVTKDTIKNWLRHLGIHDIPSIEAAATSASGFDTIAQTLVLTNVATKTRFSPDGQSLVLYRDST